MESMLLKIMVVIIKMIGVMVAAADYVFSGDKDAANFVEDNGWANILFNVSTGTYLTIIGDSVLNHDPITIHSLFEAIFFYLGGVGSLVWIAFKIKLGWLDHKIKNETLKEKQMQNKVMKEVIEASELNK